MDFQKNKPQLKLQFWHWCIFLIVLFFIFQLSYFIFSKTETKQEIQITPTQHTQAVKTTEQIANKMPAPPVALPYSYKQFDSNSCSLGMTYIMQSSDVLSSVNSELEKEIQQASFLQPTSLLILQSLSDMADNQARVAKKQAQNEKESVYNRQSNTCFTLYQTYKQLMPVIFQNVTTIKSNIATINKNKSSLTKLYGCQTTNDCDAVLSSLALDTERISPVNTRTAELVLLNKMISPKKNQTEFSNKCASLAGDFITESQKQDAINQNFLQNKPSELFLGTMYPQYIEQQQASDRVFYTQRNKLLSYLNQGYIKPEQEQQCTTLLPLMIKEEQLSQTINDSFNQNLKYRVRTLDKYQYHFSCYRLASPTAGCYQANQAIMKELASPADVFYKERQPIQEQIIGALNQP